MKLQLLTLIGVLLTLVQFVYGEVDTNTVNKWNDQALNLAYTDPYKAMEIAEKALKASQKIGFSRGEVRALIRKGIIYDVQSKNEEAIGMYNQSLELARKTNDKKAIASNLNNLGLIFWKNNRLTKALSYLNRAYRMFGKLSDEYNCASAANNIGLIYEEMLRPKEAIGWGRIALKHAIRAEDEPMMFDIYSNMGNAFNTMGNNDSSRIYVIKSIDGYRKTGNKYGLGMSLCNLGIIMTKDPNFREAVPLFLESMAIAKEIGNDYSFASSAYNLSNTYLLMKEYAKVEEVLKEAYPIARRLKSNELSFKIAFALAKAAYRRGDLKQGDSYMSAYLKFHQKYFDEVLNKNLTEAEKKFELKNERERRLLEQKESGMKIKRAQDARFNDNLLWSAVALVVISGLVMVFFIIRKRNLQKELINERAVFAATIEERKRISYDLHDHVGSQLSYVVNNLELIQHQEKENDRIKRTFAMSQAAMNSLRDTVWALHSEELTMGALGERMENLARKMFEQLPNVSISFKRLFNPESLVQQEHTMHVIRIFQEAVNNAYKHSGTTFLEVELGETAQGLYFIVKDNGVGIAENPEKPFHYGLQSMRERASKIKADLSINGSAEAGVVVRLDWPKNNPIA